MTTEKTYQVQRVNEQTGELEIMSFTEAQRLDYLVKNSRRLIQFRMWPNCSALRTTR